MQTITIPIFIHHFTSFGIQYNVKFNYSNFQIDSRIVVFIMIVVLIVLIYIDANIMYNPLIMNQQTQEIIKQCDYHFEN